MFPSKSCNCCILFPVGNLNVELMKHSTYGGGVGSGRVRLFSAIAGRVNVSPGRVGSKKCDPWTTLSRTGNFKLHSTGISEGKDSIQVSLQQCSMHAVRMVINFGMRS